MTASLVSRRLRPVAPWRSWAHAALVVGVACRPAPAWTVAAEPGDLLVVSRLGPEGLVLDARVVAGPQGRLGFEGDDRVVAFVIAAGDLAASDGGPLEDAERAQITAGRTQDPPLDSAGCGRCLGPTDSAPWPVYSGERCPLPEFAQAASWPESDDAGAIAAARSGVVLERAGTCGWPNVAPARCVPSPPEVAGFERDCRANFDASRAWPKRQPEVAMSRVAFAEACAIVGACGLLPGDARNITAACAQEVPRDELLAIPLGSTQQTLFPPLDVRFGYLVDALRATLATTGDCERARALLVPRPEPLVCSSEGCRWRSADPPEVTCRGDVATLVGPLGVHQRDCAAVSAICDPSSATGCTDRPIVECHPSTRDRCRGAVKLGCSGSGQVSFEDCGRIEGGVCVDDPDQLGSSCQVPRGAECTSADQRCDAQGRLELCALGAKIVVDCLALGLSACVDGACAPP